MKRLSIILDDDLHKTLKLTAFQDGVTINSYVVKLLEDNLYRGREKTAGKWTQEELEKLYEKVNERGQKDPAFMEKVLEDTKAAMEETAGRRLPEELKLKNIATDKDYAEPFVMPDFADGEFNAEDLSAAAGGVGDPGEISEACLIEVCSPETGL